jgi:rRNA-processing protein FCF1
LKSKTVLIVLDANFILLPFQFKIDYLNEIRNNLEGTLRFIIFQQVLNELKAKANREIRTTRFKRLLDGGLVYLETNKEKFEIDFLEDIKDGNESTDDFLFRKTKEQKDKSHIIFLATNDSDLRRRARLANLITIYLRQKKYLVIERT